MLIAQVSAQDASTRSYDIAVLVALLIPIIVCILVAGFLVLVLRHLRFNRETLHAERLKMIEAGYPLEEPESTKRQQKFMHNAFWISFWMVFAVPSSAFSAATAATAQSENTGFIVAIWTGAAAASIAAVVSAAVLMIYSRASHDEDDLRAPSKKL